VLWAARYRGILGRIEIFANAKLAAPIWKEGTEAKRDGWVPHRLTCDAGRQVYRLLSAHAENN